MEKFYIIGGFVLLLAVIVCVEYFGVRLLGRWWKKWFPPRDQ